MSVRIAVGSHQECAVVTRALTMPQIRVPANDQDDCRTRELPLREALLHFAAHGLSAAERAREKAERCFFAGNRRDYLHWMEICRVLDRRMADFASRSSILDRR